MAISLDTAALQQRIRTDIIARKKRNVELTQANLSDAELARAKLSRVDPVLGNLAYAKLPEAKPYNAMPVTTRPKSSTTAIRAISRRRSFPFPT